MSIYNISAIKNLIPGGNHYSYTRIKNLLMGLKGNSSKKDIQQVRKLLKQEWVEVDNTLEKLENQ